MYSTRYSCQVLMKLNFLRQVSDSISSVMNIRPVVAELFRADGRAGVRSDGQTNMTKLIVTFRSFVSEPNKYKEWAAAYSGVFSPRSVHSPAVHLVSEINISQCLRFSTACPFIDALFFAKLRFRWLRALSATETCINQCRFAAPLFFSGFIDTWEWPFRILISFSAMTGTWRLHP